MVTGADAIAPSLVDVVAVVAAAAADTCMVDSDESAAAAAVDVAVADDLSGRDKERRKRN